MRVLIVENQPERLAMLVPALEAAGCVVTATLNSARSLDVQIQALRPDVVIIAQDSPDRDTLEHICVVNQDCPRPIVMFTGDGSPDSIRAATQAGVTSYVVDGLDPARIRPILDVAVSRFEAFQALHDQLEQTRLELVGTQADRPGQGAAHQADRRIGTRGVSRDAACGDGSRPEAGGHRAADSAEAAGVMRAAPIGARH